MEAEPDVPTTIFTVIYKWRIHETMDAQFRHVWRLITQRILEYRGSHGSRLHRGDDGFYVAIAFWPSRERWAATTPEYPDEQTLLAQLRACIVESQPTQLLTVCEDLWQR